MKSNPNGVTPAESWTSRPNGRPSAPTDHVRIRFVAFSVTTSESPSGVMDTSAGSLPAMLSDRVDPAIGTNALLSVRRNPVMLPKPVRPLFST